MTVTVQEPLITVGQTPRNSRTDPDGMRFYSWPGAPELPSVTTVQRLAGIGHRLHAWIVGEVADYAIGHAKEHAERIDQAATVDELRRIALAIRHELYAAGTAKRDEAGALGTAVHHAATSGLHPDDVPDDVRPRLLQFLDWVETSGTTILAVEFQTWNLTVGYAGTGDLLVRLRDGSVWLADIKTGAELSDHALQLIAYLNAEFVGNDGVVDDELTALLHSCRGMAVLHLTNTGWEFQSIQADSWAWEAFCGLVRFATWKSHHAQSADVIVAKRKGGVVVPGAPEVLPGPDPVAVPA